MPARVVLLVDDAVPIRAMLATALRSRGIPSEQASDGEQALSILESRDFEVLVLDLMMPKVSGLEVLRSIEQGLVPRPPFIFVVTAASDELLEHLDPSLVHGVLRKPFDLFLFVDIVQALIEREPDVMNVSNPRRSDETQSPRDNA